MDTSTIDRALRTGARRLADASAVMASLAATFHHHAGPAARRLGAASRAAWQAARAHGAALAARLRDRLQERQAQPARPRISRGARAAWLAQLEEMGPGLAEDMLHRSGGPHAGPQAQVRFIDAGVAHGRQRYPTRQFVEDWLHGDAEPADLRLWRAAAIAITLVALASMGMLAALN